MKLGFVTVAFAVLGSLSTALVADTTLNYMTFNIRFDNPDDGEHAWPVRREKVASVIRFHQADIIGMQEVLRRQIDELEDLLPEYRWIGVGRNDGLNGGEFSPIFYRADRFSLVNNGTFWLSETPAVAGSVGWDAALTRIASWAVMEDISSGTRVLLLNTHFDHRGTQARTESARLLVGSIEALADGLPVIVGGDFNVPPTAEAYQVMTGYLDDSYVRSETVPHGVAATNSGFEVGGSQEPNRIDYVFVDRAIRVLRYGALTDQWDGSYPSDHLPVLVELVIP